MSQLLKYLYHDTDIYNIQSRDDLKTEPSIKEKVIILITHELSKANTELLKNILSAISVNIEDSYLASIGALPEAEFISRLDSKIIFSFGVHKMIDIPQFEGHADFSIVEFGSNRALLSCNLNDLESDREMKIKLWRRMKESFI